MNCLSQIEKICVIKNTSYKKLMFLYLKQAISRVLFKWHLSKREDRGSRPEQGFGIFGPLHLHHTRLATDACCHTNACALTAPTILRCRSPVFMSGHDFNLTSYASITSAVYFLLRYSRTSRPAHLGR